MAERRTAERRRMSAGEHVDVTRIEHENLCGQMDEVLRMLRRIEGELHAQGERIAAIESTMARSRRQAS